MENIKYLKTGDLILCSWHNKSCKNCCFNCFDNIIRWGSHSNWTHSAVVLKDPTFIHPSLKGLYVWESSKENNPDPQDCKYKLGVQITPLHELLNFISKLPFCKLLILNFLPSLYLSDECPNISNTI